jgi:chromosome segregation ATPase
MDSSEHIIRLIVQGINQLGNLADKVTGEQNKMTKAQERHDKSVKDTKQSVEDLKTEYKKFVDEVKRGEKDYDSARTGLARFSAEFDKFAKKRPIGSPASEELNRVALAAKRLSEQLKVAHEAERKLGEQDVRDRVRREEERQAATAQTLRNELKAEEQGVKARQSLMSELLETVRKDNEERITFNRELTRMEVDEERRRTQVRIDEATKSAQKTAEVSRRQDVQAAPRTIRQRIGSFFGREDTGPRKFVQKLESITKSSGSAERGVSRMDRVLERLHGTSDHTAFSIAKVDNNLRGLLVVGVIAFAQQLISALISLGATLFSVGAAAVQAGAAIGGAFVAAAGQAIPVIGLLVAAFGRIGAVFKAVDLFNKQTTRSGRDQAATADAQAAAADRVA